MSKAKQIQESLERIQSLNFSEMPPEDIAEARELLEKLLTFNDQKELDLRLQRILAALEAYKNRSSKEESELEEHNFADIGDAVPEVDMHVADSEEDFEEDLREKNVEMPEDEISDVKMHVHESEEQSLPNLERERAPYDASGKDLTKDESISSENLKKELDSAQEDASKNFKYTQKIIDHEFFKSHYRNRELKGDEKFVSDMRSKISSHLNGKLNKLTAKGNLIKFTSEHNLDGSAIFSISKIPIVKQIWDPKTKQLSFNILDTSHRENIVISVQRIDPITGQYIDKFDLIKIRMIEKEDKTLEIQKDFVFAHPEPTQSNCRIYNYASDFIKAHNAENEIYTRSNSKEVTEQIDKYKEEREKIKGDKPHKSFDAVFNSKKVISVDDAHSPKKPDNTPGFMSNISKGLGRIIGRG